MPKSRIAVTLAADTVEALDRLVRESVYANRSQAVEAAVAEKLARLKRRRLAEECAKLNPRTEQSLADEGHAEDADRWPEY